MKKALITGASGGIGLEVAKQLSAQNYSLTLVARSEDKLKKTMTALKGSGHDIWVADLSKPEDLQKLVKHLESQKYDLLINNAGAGIYGKFIETPLEDQLASMKLNMDALVVLSYAYLKSAKHGDTLINVASLLAHSSFPGASVYAATKSFVANFSESLWYEFKDKGVSVIGFNPGATRSNFHVNAGRQTNSYPNFVLSTVEDVAKELLSVLGRTAKPRVVPGLANRLMLFGFRFLSRKSAVNIMGKISPGMK